MPALPDLRVAEENNQCHTHPENIPLRLPSGLPRTLWPANSLPEKEKRVRIAQAYDSLTELRRLLRITLGLWEYKYTQLGPSQRANTRARSMITRFNDKISRCVDRYRAARTALLVLDPNGDWSIQLLELKPEHVKGPGRGKEDASEGRRELSWIWMAKSDRNDIDKSNASEDEIGDCKSS
jgi:hypothetical protein